VVSGQVIERGALGELSRVGQGGQGVVYAAPKVKTKFAAAMVYKEYKPAVVAGIDFTALAAMPALVEDSLSYTQAERLVSVAAWPCRIVEDSGTPTGFVMPAIPEAFFTTLNTVKGSSHTAAEFQHLLNHSSVLGARGITLDDAQRYGLLRETASTLAFLHKHGVCVGDISPKNLLYGLSPHEAVYFIDCDAMRINEVSALTQVETPGWDVPAGEELATIYSDTYKLGLLALRLLAGDQDTTTPAHLPDTTPALLRQLITDTLTNPPQRRPLPEAWTYVLGHAIEEAQHRAATSTPALPASPAVAALAPPEIPVVHSRPTAVTAKKTIATSNKATARRTPTKSSPPITTWTPPPAKSGISTTAVLLGALGLTVIVALAIVLTVVLTKDNNNTQAATPTTAPATYSSTTSPADFAPAPTLDPEAAALQQLQQLAAADHSFVTGQLAENWLPQLSSKRPGVFDDGIVYDNASTLQEHQRLRAQYNARLLWSGDWTNFDGSDYWVTIAPITFPDSASALSWCKAQGLDSDHCYAEFVSTHSRGGTAHN
jgi:serine/threonine protein kinase